MPEYVDMPDPVTATRAVPRVSRASDPPHHQRIHARTGALIPAQLLALQRSVGNKATALAIGGAVALQRDCGCGGSCGGCGPEEGEPASAEQVPVQRDCGCGGACGACGSEDAEGKPDSVQRDVADPRPSDANASSGLIVDDDAQDVGFTQLKKTDFIGRTRSAVQTAVSVVPGVDPEAAETELATRTQLASQQKAPKLEADIKSQVPGARMVPFALGYIPLIATFAAAQAAKPSDASNGSTDTPAAANPAPVVSRQVDDGPRLWSGWEGPVRLKGLTSDSRPKATPAALRSRMGDGAGLGGAQASMESAFGTSFSDVRVHTGSAAAHASDEFGARAFTIGNHIAFGSGEYQPGTVVGDALLAHELAHTIQQRGAADANVAAASAEPTQEGVDSEEHEADHSAMRVVSRLWNGLAGGAQFIAEAMPRLRTGLRIRCCKTTKCCNIAAPTGALKIVEPNHDCNPGAAERDDVFRAAQHKGGLTDKPTEYGLTGVSRPPSDVATYIDNAAVGAARDCPENCKPAVADRPLPQLSLSPFEYVKAGSYEDIPALIPADRCPANLKGIQDPKTKKKFIKVPTFEVVTQEQSDRFRAAEIEHCQDTKQAWRLTYGRYLGAVQELKDGFCVDGGDAGGDAGAVCQQEYQKRLKDRTGFDSDRSVHAIFDCLANQSSDRDTKKWHTYKIKEKRKLEPDCSKADLVNTDTSLMPEVGKHPTAELVKGCGEPTEATDGG